MVDSVSKRQTLLEESINKKEQSNCPNTSVDLSISPTKDTITYHDDSGYTGLDSTPRPYRRRNHRSVKKPRFNNSTLPIYSNSTAEIIHYIVVIVVAASLCFGILVGTMVRERNNMK